jgi:uncharacterized protein YxjI
MLTRRRFLIKEKVGLLKLTDRYDVFDPDSGDLIGFAQEKISGLLKVLRLVGNKILLPTKVEIRDNNEQLLFSINKGFQFFRAKVTISDSEDNQVGFFKSKLFSPGGGFFVFDNNERLVAEIRGDWKGWNFRFIGANGNQIGVVTKKWAGIGKELFTSADNYLISLDEGEGDTAKGLLLLAAGLAIDIVYKTSR